MILPRDINLDPAPQVWLPQACRAEIAAAPLLPLISERCRTQDSTGPLLSFSSSVRADWTHGTWCEWVSS